ncbi:hypothetical protein D3C79_581870 [compost metagenome]
MGQHEGVFGMRHGELHLLGRQAHVHRVQHRSQHRDSEKTLQITMAVPVQHRHRIPCLDAQFDQRMGQLMNTAIERRVVVATDVSIDDRIASRCAHTGLKQACNQQGRGFEAFSARQKLRLMRQVHHSSSGFGSCRYWPCL